MKIRYIAFTIFIYYIILVLLMIVVETLYLQSTVRGIQETMRTAGDMALEHTQYIDDFLAFREEDAYYLAMNTNMADFEQTEVFEAMYGLSVSSEDDLEQVYDNLYNNNEFFDVMDLSADIKVPIRFYDRDPDLDTGAYPSLVWYEIPRALTMGADFMQSAPAVQSMSRIQGASSPDLKDKMVELYGMEDTVREVTSFEDDGETKKYFNTPLNTGITYLNRDMLSALFANNIDLQMRMKYKDNPNVSSTIGCSDYNPDTREIRTETFVCGMTYNKDDREGRYNSSTHGEDQLAQYNPVSDGRFTYLRYDEINGTSNGSLYTGLPTKIEYKIIDMHSSANDPILRAIWGNKTGERQAGSSKADYFKQLNQEKNFNFESELVGFYDEYPIMVAKVTFYADIIIPYFTPTFRGLQLHFGGDSGVNFLEIATLNAQHDGELASRRFQYTRYFAVAP